MMERLQEDFEFYDKNKAHMGYKFIQKQPPKFTKVKEETESYHSESEESDNRYKSPAEILE